MILSIVIPVYNEGSGLLLLADRLQETIRSLGIEIEVLFVDDHSQDESLQILQELSRTHPSFRYLRLARNSGSHIAILAGLEHARGDCVVFMAADLQDPPELIAKMLELWQQGNRTVWAVRAKRAGVPLIDRVFARVFYWLINRFGEVSMPPDGADFALIDRTVIDALLRSAGANPSLFCEIAKLGFRQAEIPYVKEARQFGATKWNFRKRLKLFADTFVAVSYAPMRAMSYLGLAFNALGFLCALVIAVVHLAGAGEVPGYASIMVAVLTIGGVQMLMLGVLGEYLWRTLDESRHRPRYFIEAAAPQREPASAVSSELDTAKPAVGPE
jgi:glycosyltransferase involved in cell wall biosynthesis